MNAPLFAPVLTLVASSLLLTAMANADEPAKPLLKDDFTQQKLKLRRAVRGDWKIAGGVAQCTQDDALYKQFKNHGPIIFYDVPTTGATIRYAYKPAKCKTVVFTVNGAGGHVFRFVTSDRGVNVRAFPPQGKTKSIKLAGNADIKLQDGKWTPVVVTLQGDKATIVVGNAAPVTVSHASLNRPGKNISIGFSFGSLAVKEFQVTP